MLNAKPLKNNFHANKQYAKIAQDLIQCWNSLNEDARRNVVADLNKKYGIKCSEYDHEVAMMVLREKLNGDFKNFI
jgi:hypothetical protein